MLDYAGGGRRMVMALKRHDRLDIAPALAAWMLKSAGPVISDVDLIAPVPLHAARLLRRKFNQSAELARHIAGAAAMTYTPDLLTRIRKTESQKGKDRAARFENMRAAIIPTPRHRLLIKGKRILLIDDVLTTGATLSASTEACFSAGAANVNILVLARVEPRAKTSIFAGTNVKE